MLPRTLRTLFSPADVAAFVALAGLAVIPRDWPAQEPPRAAEPAAALVARVAAAERAFADSAASQGVRDAFLAFVADSGVVLAPGAAVGRAQMAAAPPPPPSAPRGSLVWHPAWVEASPDGDLAVSTGPYESRAGGADTTTRHGQFLTVWKRQPDGAYRFLMDGGIQHGAPAPGMPTAASARAGHPAEGALVATLAGASATRAAAPSPQAARASLVAADSTYAARAATDWAGAAAAAYAADVRLMRNGRFPIVGRAAARDSLAAWHHPLPAQRAVIDLSRDGTLAVVRGTYTLPAADSVPAERGHLVRVWRRLPGRGWEIALEELLAYPPARQKR